MNEDRDDRFVWKAGDIRISWCAFCAEKHGAPTCNRYPEGIPDWVLLEMTPGPKPECFKAQQVSAD